MIAPMKKVSVICMKEDREKVLKSLQSSSLMMITACESGISGGDSDISERERRVEKLLEELKRYSKQKGMFDSLPEIEENDFNSVKPESVEICKRAEELLASRDTLTQRENALKSELDALTQWSDLEADIKDLAPTRSTTALVGQIPLSKSQIFKEEISSLPCAVEYLTEAKDRMRFVLVYITEYADEIYEVLRKTDFAEAVLPIASGKAENAISEREQELTQITKQKEKISKDLEVLCEASKTDIETLFEQYKASSERNEIRLGETVETVIINGWTRADSCKTLKKELEKAVNVFDIEFNDPRENDDVPTSLTNNKIVSQFEGITNMFNPPRYGEYDPNAVMAPWYWIIFGMMMGDVGYGVLLALAIIIGKKLMKPKGGMAQLMNVMLYSSLTTVLFGALFGSYFGEELLPPIVRFTAMGDPMKMLIITLVIGVLHIFTGMITKMVLDIKDGRIWDAIFDQLSWIAIISGIGMMFLPSLSKAGTITAIIGAAVVLLTAGRSKKGIFGKFTGGLLGLYNISAYFSDILSYSRILALSLSTGVVGMVMNILAGMVQGSVIGFILSLVIYAVGHVFNLALGLLSAYVHACRLQYIEFYGKFYEGGGTLFKPFGIKTNYINIKNKKEITEE